VRRSANSSRRYPPGHESSVNCGRCGRGQSMARVRSEPELHVGRRSAPPTSVRAWHVGVRHARGASVAGDLARDGADLQGSVRTRSDQGPHPLLPIRGARSIHRADRTNHRSSVRGFISGIDTNADIASEMFLLEPGGESSPRGGE
jgi:hypothetical protein